MKTKKNCVAATFLTVLLISLATPLIAKPASASEDESSSDDMRVVPEGEAWLKLESNIVTVLFPRNGTKPMFIWWYTNAPDKVYVVKFKGLIEWFTFVRPLLPPKPEYYNHLRMASEETWMGVAEGMVDMQEMLRYIMLQMLSELQWHSPFLSFEAARWTLIKPENITADGKIIGVSFGFNLTETPYQPRFEFAENNILIRVRFYNETVHETVPGTGFSYDVNAGEMKMDLVVNKWVWNIDALKELVKRLQAAGFSIEIPEGTSKLALWVNLASINITKLSLDQAEEKPEEIEQHSTITHMEIEDQREDVTENRTAESEIPIEPKTPRSIIKIGFANETAKLGGFFRFVSSAKVTDYPNPDDPHMVPVKAAYIAGGAHMRLFIGYPYFGNGTLEHDPSIGVDVPNIDTTPKYTVQTPTGMSATPVVLGAYVPPLFTAELMIALLVAVSATAIILYAAKWKRKTPVNMVGARTPG